MQRFLSEHRVWAFAAGSLVILAGGSIWYGAREVSNRASDMIESRIGLATEVSRAKVGWGSVTLQGMRLVDESRGLSIRIERARAEVTPWGALFSGTAAVTAIDASGVEVKVDLGRPGVERSLRRLRGLFTSRREGSPEGDASTGAGRTYVMNDVILDVRDAQGPLIRVGDIDLRKEGDQATVTVAGFLLGDAAVDHARIGRSSAAMDRADGSWGLRALSVDGGNVRWLGETDDRREPLARRLRDAVRMAMQSEVDASAGPSTPPLTPRKPRLFLSRLTPDARLELASLNIESRTPAGGVERIEDLGFALEGSGNGWFGLRGSGQTSNGGTVRVDLKVQPAQARAEGEVTVRGVSMALIAPFVPDVPFYEPEVSTISAELALEADASDQMRLRGRIELREGALASERLAPTPIEHLNIEVRGEGIWFPLERRLAIDEAQLRMGEAAVWIGGELERTDEHYRIDITAKMPPTPCNQVLGAIPKDVLGAYTGFAWSGTWGGVAHVAVDSRDLEATELTIRVRNLCEFLRLPRAASVKRFRDPFRHTVVEPDETLFEMVTGPGTENWVSLAEISPYLVEAVLSHEDARFYEHGGFAPWAIRDALVRNLREGRYVVGASTISMQLAKNLYLQRDKTIARKVQEVILTWWLENALTKDEILELYLNVIEYGPGVYGIRNASMYYFGRIPIELSPAESAFLACILPSPKRFHASYERDALTRSMRGKTSRLLEHMAKRGRITPEALLFGLAELEAFDFHQPREPLPPPRALPPFDRPADDSEDPDPFEALFVAP